MKNSKNVMPTIDEIVEEQARLIAVANQNNSLSPVEDLILVGHEDGVWFREKHIKYTFKSLTVTDLAGIKCFFETVSNREMVATTVNPETRQNGGDYYCIYTKNKNGYLSYEIPDFPGLDKFLNFYKIHHPRVKADFEALYKKLFK